jgi:DNA-binding transcriptional regulator LsrR (DeoR family)
LVQRKGAIPNPREVPLSLIYTAAQLYYEGELSQDEIGGRLSVSRSTVSRMLRRARELGIVRIEVRAPSASRELACELAERLGLRRAEIVGAVAGDGRLAALAEPVGRILSSAAPDRPWVLALGWGRTLWEVVHAGLPRLAGATVVPTIGGLDEASPYFQANEIVRLGAQAAGARPQFLHAPAMPSEELRRSMLTDPGMCRPLGLWDRIDIAVVGVGRPPRSLGAYGPAHAAREYASLGDAAGDISSRYFDIEGRPVVYPGEDRLLGVSRSQFQRAGLVVGVAAGSAKAPGILGAVHAGLIHAIVTDASTARAVLALLEAGAG